jgi:hypothetical protein
LQFICFLFEKCCIFAFMKPNRDALINEMISDIDFGMDRGEVMARFVAEWHLSTRTFDRYWQAAKKQFEEEQNQIKLERQDIKVAAISERTEYRVMSKAERMNVLSQMADGTLQVQRNVVTKDGVMVILALPDYNDRKAAIAELNKMDGEYAPIRKDLTSGGEKLPPVNFQIVLDE